MPKSDLLELIRFIGCRVQVARIGAQRSRLRIATDLRATRKPPRRSFHRLQDHREYDKNHGDHGGYNQKLEHERAPPELGRILADGRAHVRATIGRILSGGIASLFERRV